LELTRAFDKITNERQREEGLCNHPAFLEDIAKNFIDAFTKKKITYTAFQSMGEAAS